ncbi:MAG: hypothetical protein ABI193_01385 [Minicystis sp.]
MGLEYKIKPKTGAFSSSTTGRITATLRASTSFVREQAPGELWLKDAGSSTTWAYDVRVFVRPDELFVEVSSKTGAFVRDVAALWDELSASAPMRLEDGDDPDEILDPARVFRAPGQA